MNKKLLMVTLPLCVLMALAAAFLFATPAFAQDEVPPVPEEEPVDATLPEALAEAGVVLAGEDGEPVSLATEEAGELLAGNDPWFKVGTIKYSYMFPLECPPAELNITCFESTNPIQSAVDDIDNGVFTPTDGTLYFDGGTTYDIDGVIIDTIPGLKKLVGATDPATGEPTVNINLTDIFEVYSQNNFSMSGFNITGDTTNPGYYWGVLEMWGNTGTLTLNNLVVRNLAASGGTGIDIYGHLGPVVLQNVESSGNAGGGVYIDNYQTTAYPVTIKNSSFQDNGGTDWVNGLYISSNGAVLMDGVTVNYNGYNDGTYAAAFIDDSKALTVKNSVFSNNWASGLSNIYGDEFDTPLNGAVVLDNVFANDNRHYTAVDDEFGGAGINLANNGAFTANNVHANGNMYQGLIADTCFSVEVPEGSGNWVCSTTATGNVVISNSEFSHNASQSSGLLVDAKGAITLTNVEASYNQGIERDPASPEYGNPTYETAGARLYNTSFTTAFPVTVNTSTFDYNSDDGLTIESKGLVTINKVNTSWNYSDGMDIDNTFGTTAGVTFKGTTWGDNAAWGNGTGLFIYSRGNITVNYLDSYGNQYENGLIYNDLGTGSVTINKSNFSSNGEIDYPGLYISSSGTVTLTSVDATGNMGDGVYIDNEATSTPKAVKITGGDFSENALDGVRVVSRGAITLTNLISNWNGANGAYLRNTYTTFAGVQFVQPVTVSGSTFEYNDESGLEVETFGAITVKNTQSNGNTGHGAYLINQYATAPKAVTISGSTFNENGIGLTIETKGLVNLSSVEASNNSIWEAGMNPGDAVNEYVASQGDDTWWIYANQDDVISITLERGDEWWDPYLELWGFNGSDWELLTEDDDSGDGNNSQIINYTMPYSGSYYILAHSYSYDSSGNYTLKYWQGVDPGFWNDVYFYDANGLTVRNADGVGVTINKGSFVNNSGYGIDIDTKGAVKLTNVNASSNTLWGADINNRPDALTTGGVTLLGSSFNNNRDSGLIIQSNGAVVLTKTVANENLRYGASILNQPSNGTAKPNVTINNDAAKLNWWHEGFSGNDLDGLNIASYGIISLTNVNASDNGSTGAVLQNVAGYTDIKLTNSKFDDNDGYGVSVYTRGNIIFSKGTANFNQGMNGAWFESYPYPGTKNVTISNVEFNDNYGSGLHVVTNGNISLTNVLANWNYGDDAKGADLNNEAGAGNITIKTSSFNDNEDIGLLIATHGNVTLTTVHADDNEYIGALIGSDFEPGHDAKVVNISGMSTFYDNGIYTNGSGLEVYASGAVTLTNVDAAGNGGYGAYLKNIYGATPANVSVLGTLANWINWYSNNGAEGLYIVTHGVVIVNKVDASNNGVDGVHINNSGAALPANVTINTGWYNDNNGNGLTVDTKGTVLVNSLEASGNLWDGAWIDSSLDTGSVKSVTINKSKFEGNGTTGLEVYIFGNITANNLTANDNGGRGAVLYNHYIGANGTVTLLTTLGANTLNYNGGAGLYIESDRAVILNNVAASHNGWIGIYVSNTGGFTPVTLSKVTTNYNLSDGIQVTSNGSITLTNAVSMFNGWDDPMTVEVEVGHGFNLVSSNVLAKTTITNSVAIGNTGNGIRLVKFEDGLFVLTNTLYFGNDTSGEGYNNLQIIPIT